MHKNRTTTIPGILGAGALALTLALAGCAGTADSAPAESEATESEADAPKTDDAATTDDLSSNMPEATAQLTDIASKVRTTNDTAGAEKFDSLPTAEDDEVSAIESADELAEGEEDASKAPTGSIRLMGNGAQILVPDTWLTISGEDGFEFANNEMTVVGMFAEQAKAPGEQVDVEMMAQATAYQFVQAGFENVRILSHDTGYSEKGTLCASSVTMLLEVDGKDFAVYFQYLESKSYVSMLMFKGFKEDFAKNMTDINAIAGSMQFNVGEVI